MKYDKLFFLKSGIYRIILTLSLILIFWLSSCALRLPQPQALLTEFATYLDQRLPSRMARYGIPGASVALLQEGTVICSQTFGYADYEQAVPVNQLVTIRRLLSHSAGMPSVIYGNYYPGDTLPSLE